MKNKKGLFVGLGIVLAVIIIVVSVIAGGYNSLVSLEASVEAKQSSVSTQLQRRSDLIPNLVSTVKGYAAHEEEVYTAIADARSKLAGATDVDEMAEANSELSSALTRLLAISENYPELEKSENFTALQDELAGTENRITVARNDYNEAAKEYNVAIRKFPKNILAGLFGFDKADYFEADAGSEDVPEVNF